MIRKIIILALAFLAFSLLVRADELDEQTEPAEEVLSDVISLTAQNFGTIVDAEKLIMVEFFAPWCGHCKALAPEYETAATALKKDDIKLAKVDCTAETKICQSYDVGGYPTIKIFKDGKVTADYSGPRKADSIIPYMQKQLLPAVAVVTPSNFTSFKESEDVVIVGFFSGTTQDEFNVYNTVADALREEFRFGCAVNSKLASEEGLTTLPAVVVYKKFDEGKDVFTGPFNDKDLAKFVKVSSIKVLDEITPENYPLYVDSGIPIAFLFYEGEEQKEKLYEQAEQVAKEFKGKISFVFINATAYGGHADNLNLKQTWPAFGISEPENGNKFPYDQSKEITTDGLNEFCTAYINGEIKPNIKSQPIPETNDDPVYVLVADNFEETVYDTTKDVLVEFYAPWCGHCKKLAPTYDKVGEAYAPFKDKIVIAKMDATENDLPPRVPFKVGGFPTIKLFKAGEDKEIVDFLGNRSYEGFIEFLDQHAVNKVTITKAEEEKPTESQPPVETEQKHVEL
ncbi:4442_t:CDS:2 [Paraglomus brasilianum]|uniref:Protein disulfide-isomerase n=1 Tax=Paraglomus brasilianum TaxID=144538 RepID=A0A9N9FQ19_9GLOM|nr:4442_t:CDS:2 [Paraglomus brasilianum]